MSDVRVITQRIVLAIFILGAALLLAFGPKSIKVPPGSEGRTVITYWEKWTGAEADSMQVIVNHFNDTVGKEKNIFVQYLSISTVDQKTLVATASGIPPDIAGLWAEDVAQFATQDAIEPLDDLAAEYSSQPGNYKIDANYYKPVYWDGCHYQGKLYALVSTCACVALHYDKKIFEENADALRAAGLDPERAPQTIDELDAYAKILDKRDAKNNISVSGYLPGVPGWYLVNAPVWFGGHVYDDKTGKITLLDPGVVKAYEWIESYSKRLGKESVSEFQSSIGNFDSPNNPFMAHVLAMEQQGPWLANFIQRLSPDMNRWNLPATSPNLLCASDREALLTGDKKTLDDYCAKYHLTPATLPPAASTQERQQHCEWAAAPFPSAVPGQKNVTFATWDVFMIPKGAKHKKEAFEFMAFVNAQKNMEELSNAHSKNSPLAKVSPEFIANHKNPYVGVFEQLTASPNAQHAPSIPILQQVNDELGQVAQKAMLLQQSPRDALAEAQDRLEKKLAAYNEIQSARGNGSM
jgi:multiple sugar transport system substrate-binding protein